METELLDVVTPETAGDPMGKRKWVRSSLRKLSHGLAQAGYAASAPTVSRLLKKHDDALGRAVPYGIYDVQRNAGAVYVGASADTPEFAVMAIAHWWEDIGGSGLPPGQATLDLGRCGGK